MPTPVTIKFIRLHAWERAQQASVWLDGDGAHYRTASGGALENLSGYMDVWPVGKAGLGYGELGKGSLGWGDNKVSGMGLGFGILGYGELGYYNDYFQWSTSAVGVKLLDGTFKFEVRMRDAVGNVDADGGTELSQLVTSVPRPPKTLTLDSATAAQIVVSWAASPDI